ncbi:MAG TPA: hypothetical protein PLZ21_08730, partial [Armatimonadota bacterium]|nr:hypothetical protein [Armatimonadota bacterium]
VDYGANFQTYQFNRLALGKMLWTAAPVKIRSSRGQGLFHGGVSVGIKECKLLIPAVQLV